MNCGPDMALNGISGGIKRRQKANHSVPDRKIFQSLASLIVRPVMWMAPNTATKLRDRFAGYRQYLVDRRLDVYQIPREVVVSWSRRARLSGRGEF